MKKCILLSSCLAIAFTSCTKDKDEEAENVTPTVINLSGTYKISKVTASFGGSTQDVTSQRYPEACERDDTYELKSDLTYIIVDAGAQCSSSNNWTDTWSLTNTTAIVLNGNAFTIKNFSGTSLELTQNEGGATLSTYYVKQ